MTEKIIDQILSTRPDVSREEILERLEKQRRKTGGLIADYVLVRMIAAKLGVKTSGEVTIPTLSIKDLVPGLSNVTITGRVVAVSPSKTFGADRSGKFASLLVADRNDVFRVVLWNDKTDILESGKIKAGGIVRFSHGYTKENRVGRVELHMGDRGEIEANPCDVEPKDYPTITKFAMKIGRITKTDRNRRVHVIGTVKELFSASTFERQDSSTGKVMRIIVADETGSMAVVVWNDKVDELEKIVRRGVGLQIVNARVKEAMSGGLEIHVDTASYVESFEPEEEFSRLAVLTVGSTSVNVEGEVVTEPAIRNVRTSKGELVNLAVFELKDETGQMWVSAWRKHVDSVENLKAGDRVVMRNVYVKRGFGNRLEISTRNSTIISVLRRG